jgi:threonine dehydrogenase-like Zn-dependent dehydrogenase
MVAAGRLDLRDIITSRYTLDNVVDAIAQSTTRTDGKILVKPNA